MGKNGKVSGLFEEMKMIKDKGFTIIPTEVSGLSSKAVPQRAYYSNTILR